MVTCSHEVRLYVAELGVESVGVVDDDVVVVIPTE